MRRNLGRLALFVVAVAIVGTLVASASAGSSSRTTHARATAKLYRIGLVLPDLSNLYIAGIRDGAQAQGKKSDAEILVKGTNDAAGQTNAMLAYVGAKVDAIIVDAIDGNAIVPRSRRRTRRTSRWSRSSRTSTAAPPRRSSPAARITPALRWATTPSTGARQEPVQDRDRRGHPRRPVRRRGEQGVPGDRRARTRTSRSSAAPRRSTTRRRRSGGNGPADRPSRSQLHLRAGGIRAEPRRSRRSRRRASLARSASPRRTATASSSGSCSRARRR